MKLIITRPLADSKRMQDYFELRGVECLINPLLEILYKKRNINFSNYDRVLFTSKHAVRSLVNKSQTFSKKKFMPAADQPTLKSKSLLLIMNIFFMKA